MAPIRADEPFRVLYFTDALGVGGTVMHMVWLLEDMDKTGLVPAAVISGDRSFDDVAVRMESTGVRVYRFSAGRNWKLSSSLTLARAIRTHCPHIVHFHQFFPFSCRYHLPIARVLRVPRIIATEHLPFEKKRNSTTRIWLKRAMIRFIDHIICVSESSKKTLLRQYGLDDAKVSVIHNGVRLNEWIEPSDRQEVRRSLGLVEGAPVVLTVAALNMQKGHSYLLQAGRELVNDGIPDLMILCAGDGVLRQELQQMARDIGLEKNVRFLGKRDDVKELHAASDLFVLPSLFEGFPYALLEAMASARPVVATAVDGNVEAVSDGVTGRLVPAKDSHALAGAIRSVLSKPAEAEAMGRCARRNVENRYSAAVCAERTLQLYRQVLRG